MVAIRADQELMAEFLVDNDIDVNHTCALIVSIIGLDRYNFSAYICKYFLIHQFQHMFWVLKRTVSLRRFF